MKEKVCLKHHTIQNEKCMIPASHVTHVISRSTGAPPGARPSRFLACNIEKLHGSGLACEASGRMGSTKFTLFETVTSYYIIEMAGRPAGHTALRTYTS